MQVRVRLAPVLASLAGGGPTLALDVPEGATVADVLACLDALHPAIGRRVQDEQGSVRRHVNVFVGSDNVRDLDGVQSAVTEGAEVTILPAISGG